jgi:23S rRNA A2030 N6-methylase RlmJ
MKLTVIGGGGIRSPLLVSSTLKRSERINLEEICLMLKKLAPPFRSRPLLMLEPPYEMHAIS